MTDVAMFIPYHRGLSLGQRFAKRAFDVIVSAVGLGVTGWVIALAYVLAARDTGESGFFRQWRVGRDGQLFQIRKLRTMRSDPKQTTTVTTSHDARITKLGAFLRRTKLDELPQLINVLKGEMSFVGPRPDVAGFADVLRGEDRIVLSVRPGITGPASLAFRDEEQLLAQQDDPERYNREIIFPQKVAINRAYVENYRFIDDIGYIVKTLVGNKS